MTAVRRPSAWRAPPTDKTRIRAKIPR